MKKFKKRGFTLIELLAVIVILAIILLIVMPIVLIVINDARKGAFEATTRGILKTAENECLADIVNNEGVTREIVFSDYEMGEETLAFSGRGPKEGNVYINDQCEVAMAVHDGNWCAKKYYDDEIIIEEYDGATAWALPRPIWGTCP